MRWPLKTRDFFIVFWALVCSQIRVLNNDTGLKRVKLFANYLPTVDAQIICLTKEKCHQRVGDMAIDSWPVNRHSAVVFKGSFVGAALDFGTRPVLGSPGVGLDVTGGGV